MSITRLFSVSWLVKNKLIVLTLFLFIPMYHVDAQVFINSTNIVTNGATIIVNQPITADKITVDANSMTTRATSLDDLYGYSFDRVGSVTPYTVYWTGISSSKISFDLTQSGVTDARLTTTGNPLFLVTFDGIQTGINFNNGVNTVIINTAKLVQEYFGVRTGGGPSNNPTAQVVTSPVSQLHQQGQNIELGIGYDNMVFIGVGLMIAAIIAAFVYSRKPRKKHGSQNTRRKKGSIEQFNKDIRSNK